MLAVYGDPYKVLNSYYKHSKNSEHLFIITEDFFKKYRLNWFNGLKSDEGLLGTLYNRFKGSVDEDSKINNDMIIEKAVCWIYGSVIFNKIITHMQQSSGKKPIMFDPVFIDTLTKALFRKKVLLVAEEQWEYIRCNDSTLNIRKDEFDDWILNFYQQHIGKNVAIEVVLREWDVWFKALSPMKSKGGGSGSEAKGRKEAEVERRARERRAANEAEEAEKAKFDALIARAQSANLVEGFVVVLSEWKVGRKKWGGIKGGQFTLKGEALTFFKGKLEGIRKQENQRLNALLLKELYSKSEEHKREQEQKSKQENEAICAELLKKFNGLPDAILEEYKRAGGQREAFYQLFDEVKNALTIYNHLLTKDETYNKDTADKAKAKHRKDWNSWNKSVNDEHLDNQFDSALQAFKGAQDRFDKLHKENKLKMEEAFSKKDLKAMSGALEVVEKDSKALFALGAKMDTLLKSLVNINIKLEGQRQRLFSTLSINNASDEINYDEKRLRELKRFKEKQLEDVQSFAKDLDKRKRRAAAAAEFLEDKKLREDKDQILLLSGAAIAVAAGVATGTGAGVAGAAAGAAAPAPSISGAAVSAALIQGGISPK